ncbi:MAG: hypothetical protein R3C58_14855 [Parvularculaceae bacterium]
MTGGTRCTSRRAFSVLTGRQSTRACWQPLFAMALAYIALFGWMTLAGMQAALIRQRIEKRAMRAPSRPEPEAAS